MPKEHAAILKQLRAHEDIRGAIGGGFPVGATVKKRMDDIHAVMDAVGSGPSAVTSASNGGAMSALLVQAGPDESYVLMP